MHRKKEETIKVKVSSRYIGRCSFVDIRQPEHRTQNSEHALELGKYRYLVTLPWNLY